MSSFSIYAIALIILIVGFWAFRKVTACMFKATVAVVVAIVLLVLYFVYCR